MSITLPKLPHPVMNAMLGDDWADLFTTDQMHAHAAAVSAAKDAEIAGLRAELIKSLADNAALRADAIDRQNNVVAPLRERVRVLEGALDEVLAFQSAPKQPTIHDWGRWRRIRAALEKP